MNINASANRNTSSPRGCNPLRNFILLLPAPFTLFAILLAFHLLSRVLCHVGQFMQSVDRYRQWRWRCSRTQRCHSRCVRSAIYAIASWACAWALPLPTWLPMDNLAVWSASRLVKWHQYPLTRHSKKMKFIDPSSEIVHAARCVGITFGDSA